MKTVFSLSFAHRYSSLYLRQQTTLFSETGTRTIADHQMGRWAEDGRFDLTSKLHRVNRLIDADQERHNDHKCLTDDAVLKVNLTSHLFGLHSQVKVHNDEC